MLNIENLARITIYDGKLRGKIVYLMMNDPNIMVYDHPYYIIEKASETKPELFYNYWNDLVSLLKHENSYHHDFGLTLIANLTEVDTGNKFSRFSMIILNASMIQNS